MPAALPPRLIALGASNLARGMLALVDVARAAAGGPVQVLAALGRGRSYGVRSRLLGRTLPGIDDCGLWNALDKAPPAATTALLMDVGNDILYGIEVETILAWIDAALGRLAPHAQRIVLAGLPLHCIEQLGEWRFRTVRTVLVPSCRLSLAEVRARVAPIELGLASLAAQHGATFEPMQPQWYGLDPVHIRRRQQRAAFATLLGVAAAPPSVRLDHPIGRLRFLFAAPARRWWFGRESCAMQPARHWPDGTTLALY